MKRFIKILFVLAMVFLLGGASRAGVQIRSNVPAYPGFYDLIYKGYVVSPHVVVVFSGHMPRDGTVLGTSIKVFPYLVDYPRAAVLLSDAELPAGEHIELNERLYPYLIWARDEIDKDGGIERLIFKFKGDRR